MLEITILALDEFIAKYPLTDLAEIALQARKEIANVLSQAQA